MMDHEKLEKIMESIREKIYKDDLDRDQFEKFIVAYHQLSKTISESQNIKNKNLLEIENSFKQSSSLKEILDNMGDIKTRYPSYLDEYLRVTLEPPFLTPSSLFEPEGALSLDVHTPFGIRSVRAELALATLFPGSLTFRYGRPLKIRVGMWHNKFRADLASTHVLSAEPIYHIEINGTSKSVYRPITLRTIRPNGGSKGFRICTSCLALDDDDERCNHNSIRRLNVRNYPRILKTLGSSTPISSKNLGPLLSNLIRKVRLYEPFEARITVLGAERGITLRDQSRIANIQYDPPIGIVLQTTGLGFEIIMPYDFISTVTKDAMLQRDLTLQLISVKIYGLLSESNIPLYSHSLIMSAIISSLGMDQTMNIETIQERLTRSDFVQRTMNSLSLESNFYSRIQFNQDNIQSLLLNLQQTEISIDAIQSHAQYVLLHTIAHNILLACCITSGSKLGDLDYILNENEIMIFDSVNGGNGASKMAYEYLTTSTEFNVKNYIKQDNIHEFLKPTSFEESFFEMMLPCLGNIVNIVFLNNNLSLPESESRRRYLELNEKRITYEPAISRLRDLEIENLFPASIGYHSIYDFGDSLEAERFRELSDICVHGCPECSILGSKCNHGRFVEKYFLSKILQNRYMTHQLSDYIVDINTEYNVDEHFNAKNFLIFTIDCQNNDYLEYKERLMNYVNVFTGKKYGNRYIKFSGLWFDNNYDAENMITYYALLVKI